MTASADNPAHHSFVRSAIQMFQVLPFVEADGVDHFGLAPEELALCTASHGGEPFHVAMRLGVALKVENGAWRAVEPALLATLRQIDAIGATELGLLARYAELAILNTRGETVGAIRARVSF